MDNTQIAQLLLRMDESIQEFVKDGTSTASHLRAVSRLDAAKEAILQLQKEKEIMAKGLTAVGELMDNSYGVDGLHQNGDVAKWSTLREGGHFEGWLIDFDLALDIVEG
jgi:hypothetical protein